MMMYDIGCFFLDFIDFIDFTFEECCVFIGGRRDRSNIKSDRSGQQSTHARIWKLVWEAGANETQVFARSTTRDFFFMMNIEPAVGGCPLPRPPNRNRRAHARATPARATRGKRRLSRRELGGRYPPTPPPAPATTTALPASPETPKSRPCVLEVRVDDLGGPRGPGGFGPPRRSRSQQPRGATPHRRADRDA